MYVERDKLYCDLKYSSLFKYLINELGYSEAESTIRVNAVRLMLKSGEAVKKIEKGELSLTNAALANKTLQGESNKKLIETVVNKASEETSRGFKKFVAEKFDHIRKEIIELNEFVLKQFDQVRRKFKDKSLTSYEVILILLQRELRDPVAQQRGQIVGKIKENYKYLSKVVCQEPLV